MRLEPGDGGVAVVTLDRPPANAMNRDFFVELEAMLPRLAAPEVRAVLLVGTGRFFSAGLDLFEVFAYGPADFTDFTRRFDAGFAGLFALGLWVAWSVLAAGAANPECAVRHCPRYERVGDWFGALTGEGLMMAGLSFTGVVTAGTILFALPWLGWLWVLKKRGVVK